MFNNNFCNDLILVFSDLIDKKLLTPEIDNFKIFLEVVNKEKTKYHNIPFRIIFEPEIRIMCKV